MGPPCTLPTRRAATAALPNALAVLGCHKALPAGPNRCRRRHPPNGPAAATAASAGALLAPMSALPYTVPPIPGEEFLRVRLQRALAVPPDQRTPEVAAFVEVMQLEEQVCELLPLVKRGSREPQPALPECEETAERVLLAAAKWARMNYVCSERGLPGSFKVDDHLRPYLERGCGPPYPAASQCIARMQTLLRRRCGTQVNVRYYLWAAAAIDLYLTNTYAETTVALRQLVDALHAAGNSGTLDQQLRQLQETASGPALASVAQWQYAMCHIAYKRAWSVVKHADGSDMGVFDVAGSLRVPYIAEAARAGFHCAKRMLEVTSGMAFRSGI